MDLDSQIELEIYFADHFDTILFPVLADLYLKNNELNRARKVCEIGLKNHKNDPAGLFVLANIEKIEGNLKEAEKILKNLGYNKKTIKSFIKTVQNHVASEFQDMKEIMMGKVPKRLLN